MIFEATKLAGAFVISPEKRSDERGFFARTFCAEEFEAHGLHTQFVQANMSGSRYKHTIRGMHFQIDGAEEAKLIRCTRGAILDVIIDIRKGSNTYGQYIAEELTANNHKQLYIPEGFAHGFITLVDDIEVSYLVSQFYTPGKERGIRWNDPAFGIQWPTDAPKISEKDNNHPDFVL